MQCIHALRGCFECFGERSCKVGWKLLERGVKCLGVTERSLMLVGRGDHDRGHNSEGDNEVDWRVWSPVSACRIMSHEFA